MREYLLFESLLTANRLDAQLQALPKSKRYTITTQQPLYIEHPTTLPQKS
jgi:hypothetical protein